MPQFYSLINLGKYGSFHSNQLFGRPYHLTFEILDKADARDDRELRIVPAAELHAAALLEEAEAEETGAAPTPSSDGNLISIDKSNVNITDDPTNQTLTMAEIEELKQDETGRTKDLIAKIMQSHTALDQKTAFSLAKYTLRKHRKYMKRFTVLPLDVATLTDFLMVEKDFSKIMEVRNEVLGLIGCWANVHACEEDHLPTPSNPSSRYLMVDDTGGIVVAAMAERMGILHQSKPSSGPEATSDDEAAPSEEPPTSTTTVTQPTKPKRHHHQSTAMSATQNTITVIHSNQQPNLSLLRYFNFDCNNPTSSHPLHTNLRTLSWLQLLDPQSDSAYTEPPVLQPSELAKLKSNRRSNYHRKRRRWERIRAVTESTREGGFDGLVVASYTSAISVLRELVPLLKGGAQVVVYSPHVEGVMELTDAYSTARRTAFLLWEVEQEERRKRNADGNQEMAPEEGEEGEVTEADFPLNPTLLLAPMVQTSRVRNWQVLPGRTHPVMTSKGGAEGYVWTSTRVIPAEGRVSARGNGRRNQKNERKEVLVKVGEAEDVAMSEGTGVEAAAATPEGLGNELEGVRQTERLKRERANGDTEEGADVPLSDRQEKKLKVEEGFEP